LTRRSCAQYVGRTRERCGGAGGTLMGVTDHKSAEEALRAREERFRRGCVPAVHSRSAVGRARGVRGERKIPFTHSLPLPLTYD
jgi:hypothetical protein